MTSEWRDYVEAMARANRFEILRLRRSQSNLGDSLRWLSEAWELADRYSGSPERGTWRKDHGDDLLRLAQRLERARLTP